MEKRSWALRLQESRVSRRPIETRLVRFNSHPLHRSLRTFIAFSKAEIGAVDFALARTVSTFDGLFSVTRLMMTDD